MEQKSILITGAARGIRRAAATLLHEEGWLVGRHAADADAPEELPQDVGDG